MVLFVTKPLGCKNLGWDRSISSRKQLFGVFFANFHQILDIIRLKRLVAWLQTMSFQWRSNCLKSGVAKIIPYFSNINFTLLRTLKICVSCLKNLAPMVKALIKVSSRRWGDKFFEGFCALNEVLAIFRQKLNTFWLNSARGAKIYSSTPTWKSGVAIAPLVPRLLRLWL